MQYSLRLMLILLTLVILRTKGQVVPIYANSAMFETRMVQTAIPLGQGGNVFDFTVNPTMGVSPENHRRPFISISGI